MVLVTSKSTSKEAKRTKFFRTTIRRSCVFSRAKPIWVLWYQRLPRAFSFLLPITPADTDRLCRQKYMAALVERHGFRIQIAIAGAGAAAGAAAGAGAPAAATSASGVMPSFLALASMAAFCFLPTSFFTNSPICLLKAPRPAFFAKVSAAVPECLAASSWWRTSSLVTAISWNWESWERRSE
ncbi:hypothetical protein BU16DRAFT_224982 [Lophium mytilinum]|uniref:Uncharacterized protein n=1 Tax=Lophium mytilinum TaxID=390894 RepID=A0A6A6Q9A5_9PEZI|nr:hypothetical protein BU16DRAFT_224982 [Lophium mytilinum]